MAEDKKDILKDINADPEGHSVSAPGSGFGALTWLILAAIVLAGAMGGFALSQLVGGADVPTAAARQKQTDDRSSFDALLKQDAAGGTSWIYDAMEPVLANLDEPGVSRYVRVTLSLEMSPEVEPEKGREFLEQRMMLLRDWLTTYFAGLSLEDVRGSRNLNRIKRDVQDQFNALLFPDSKPYVRQVLFREFAVQ